MTARTRIRKTEAQKKHDHFLTLAILLRRGRLHRMDVSEHTEHTFADGERVDFYPSETYAGFAYMVVYGQSGYECGCKGFEFRHSCEHTQDANKRAIARYEVAAAEVLAAEALPEMVASGDLAAHVEGAVRSERKAAFEQVRSEVQRIERKWQAKRRAEAPLNGNQDFSLMAS